MTKITIITAVFNASATIRDCIESIQNQDYPVEHIIIDGGSTDETLDIVNEYRSGISKVISEPDRGIYDAMNKGIRLATGEIVGLLNADDIYAGTDVLPNVIELFKKKDVDSCYGDLVYVDSLDTNKVIRYWHSGHFNYRRFYWGWMPPHPTFFVRMAVYRKYGLFNLGLGSAADYEMMLRLLVKQRITTAYIPGIMVKMRTGGKSNASFANRMDANLNDRLAWKTNGLRPYPWTLYLKPLRKLSQWIRKAELR